MCRRCVRRREEVDFGEKGFGKRGGTGGVWKKGRDRRGPEMGFRVSFIVLHNV